MNPEKQKELQASLKLVDDDARPLAGSCDQYTRLAIIQRQAERGEDRHFALFAESSSLFNHIHDTLKTQDWIREGFDKQWIYIEEVLRRPSATDDISGYLRALDQKENDLWIALFNFVLEQGLLERFATKLRGKTYGLPKEELPEIGLPIEHKD